MTSSDLELDSALAERVARLGLEFEAEFCAAGISRRPDDLDALARLGHALTRLGRHAAALVVDEELVRREPEDETARYNLACSLTLVGRTDDAFRELERAVELGYADAAHLESDADLAALREDARFAELVARLRAA